VGERCGLKSCLKAWNSAEADSVISPQGFHELREGFTPSARWGEW